jgi:hypothetical protein
MKLDEGAGCGLLQQETAFGGSTITLSRPTAGPSSSYQNGSPTHQSGFYNYDKRREKHRIVLSAYPSPTHSTQSQVPCYYIGHVLHVVACFSAYSMRSKATYNTHTLQLLTLPDSVPGSMAGPRYSSQNFLQANF